MCCLSIWVHAVLGPVDPSRDDAVGRQAPSVAPVAPPCTALISPELNVVSLASCIHLLNSNLTRRMPLASSGTWASLGRQVAAGVRNAPHARGLHVPRRAPQLPSTAQRVFQTTKGLAQSLFGHLTTPGYIGRQAGPRSLHHLTAGRTIQNGLSLPARQALARPLGLPKLPRAPAVPRGIHQVGLGTARTFATGRPIFAHLAENVPVAGRALSEADWKIQRKKELGKLAKKIAKKEKTRKVKAEKVVLHPAASVNTSTLR